jgi:hypothetical protein
MAECRLKIKFSLVFPVETVDTPDNLLEYRVRLLLLTPLGISGHCPQSIKQTRRIQQASIRNSAQPPNGLRYPLVGGVRFASGGGKTRSQKNTRKWRRIPPVGCTLCWAVFTHSNTLPIVSQAA